ncbi:MFS general substrate transporter [Sistotremastrum suecicum HHB10207 ss-3]|uniref:MFS general substrate transporter n=1 Tax=Sistotremastrum suecicum HHB10207 ss-3 TaxID=1314776 RepID=A0A166A5F6_9AGAM|nr:MFS general substrate transporter [Sistotremastrum suecicum HHB10207 ss-3]
MGDMPSSLSVFLRGRHRRSYTPISMSISEPHTFNDGRWSISSRSDKLGTTISEVEQCSAIGEGDDGGLDGWMTVFGGFLIQAATIGHVNAFGVYEDYYKRVYLSEESSSLISWIGSTQLSLLFGLGIVAGVLFDQGRFKLQLYTSTLLYILCNFMLSLAKPHQFYQLFLSQGLGMGLAMGLIYSPSFSVISHHFRRRRSFAMGIVAGGAAIGAIFQTIMLNYLFESLGFQNAIRANASLNACMLIIACFTIKCRPRMVKPEEEKRNKSYLNVLSFFREAGYMIVIAGGVLINLGLFFPAVYIQLFSFNKGFPRTFSFYSLAILNASSVLGRVLLPVIADHHDPLLVLIPICFSVGVSMFAFLAVSSIAGDAIVAAVFGFFSGAYSALLAPTMSSMSKSEGEIGARMGIAITFAAISCLAGPPINGVLLGNEYTWSKPIIFSGACIMLGCICLVVAKYYHTTEVSAATASSASSEISHFRKDENSSTISGQN